MQRSFLYYLLLILPLIACTNVQQADYKAVPPLPENVHAAPAEFTRVKIDMPTGQDVGVQSAGSRMCSWPYAPVGRQVISKAIDVSDMDEIVHDTLEGQGFDIVSTVNLIFDEEVEEELLRSEYKIAARLIDIQLDACYQETGALLWLLTSQSGMEGELFIDVEWSVYDALHRKLAYKTTTKGYTNRKVPNREGLTLMINEAFEMAAHNLGTDQGLRDLLFYGIEQSGWKKDEPEEADARPRIFDPLAPVHIDSKTLSQTPFAQHADSSRKAAVIIQAGSGHGSGFFITEEGHILTNSHVVGAAQRVRIVPSDKGKAITAEVLRIDRARDVALLKLETLPDDLKIKTLPIRTEWPGIAEDVYVVGAPLSASRLNDTVTKGIVSTHRKNVKFLGTKQNFIQADVLTHGGNSGGPLLDTYGNIVGITVGGWTIGAAGADAGLNYFIPIEEALQTLDIKY